MHSVFKPRESLSSPVKIEDYEECSVVLANLSGLIEGPP